MIASAYQSTNRRRSAIRSEKNAERTIKAVFAAEPDDVFTTEELCRKVYPRIKQVQKKHRVAVIRAAKKLQLNWVVSDGGVGRTLVFTAQAEEHMTSKAKARERQRLERRAELQPTMTKKELWKLEMRLDDAKEIPGEAIAR